MTPTQRYMAKNLEENRCPICGKRRTVHWRCEKCNAKHVKRMKAHRKAVKNAKKKTP